MNPDKLGKFREWLRQCGAELLKTTNEWEVLRFRANGQVGIIYTNKKGQWTYSEHARKLRDTFQSGRHVKLANPVKRGKVTDERINALMERDGRSCFYCGGKLTHKSATVEHLCPVAHGGPNHMANLALACEQCNKMAGNQPITEKVRMRDAMRKKQSIRQVG